MAVTMHDVARRAGVSQRTVSNVVTGSVPVRPETRAKVDAAIRELGYRPHASARALRRGRTSTITLALPDLRERYFADLAQAVIDRAGERDLRVLVATTRGRREQELAILRGEALLTDGVVMSSVAMTVEDETMGHPDFPVVLVGDRDVGRAIAHVGADNRRAAHDAVAHLLDLGRRRVALLGHGARWRTAEQRTEGFLAALEERGVAVDPALLIGSAWTYDGGADGVARLLATGAPVDAVFAMNDTSALGALRAFHAAGLRVPEDVAVIGFDNIREGEVVTPGLSSVGPTPDDLALAAMRVLALQLEGQQDAPEPELVPHRLVVRASTAGDAAAAGS